MYQATSIRFQFHRRMWNKLTASSRCELLQEINELLNEIVNRTGGSYLIIIDPIAWHWWHAALSVDYNLLSTENKTNRHFLSMLLLWMYMYTYKNTCTCMKWRHKEWELGSILSFSEYEFTTQYKHVKLMETFQSKQVY